jgi:arylsulfatase A-like enzyme
MASIENVLLVSIDCLRADRYLDGIESGLTPTFETLRNRGTSFDATYTVSNATDPSLTSFMTGTYPFDHGVVENGWGLDDEQPLAAEGFQDAGFDTFAVVSVDHLNDEHSNLGRGFDEYYDGAHYDTLYPILSRIYDTKLFNMVFGAIKNRGVGQYTVKGLLRQLGLIQLHCRSAQSVTEDATEAIDGVDSPFFGWVHYFDVHEPRNAPRKLQGEHDEYTAAMMLVDDYVDRLCNALQDRGLYDNTLIVLTGDHGEALGDHGYTGHGRTLYDEELHVPLEFAHESLPSKTVSTQIRTIDILPTLLDIAGGDSLDAAGSPVFDDGPVQTDRPVFSTTYPVFGDLIGIRDGNWKLIRNRDEGVEELYDLSADPEETDDIVTDAETERAELARSLDEWVESFEGVERKAVDAETDEMLADLGYTE